MRSVFLRLNGIDKFKNKNKNELKLLSNDVITKMAYQKLTDKGIVTSHNSPVNLPVKGQARGKTVDTIETSSEKITLKLQKKNSYFWRTMWSLRVKAYFLTNFFQSFSSLSGSISSVSWSLTWGTLAKWMIFVARLIYLSSLLFTLFTIIYCSIYVNISCFSWNQCKLQLFSCKINVYSTLYSLGQC